MQMFFLIVTKITTTKNPKHQNHNKIL